MAEKTPNGKLYYYKWTEGEAVTMEEAFSNEEAGILFFAVMAYVRDGTVRDIPDNLKFAFLEYKRKIDLAAKKYEEKCAVNAENGSKGGKAKAAKAKEAAKAGNGEAPARPKFKPPTRKMFSDAVERFIDNGEIQEGIERYDIDRLFDDFSENNWAIGGEPIVSRDDWEDIILAKFGDSDSVDEYFFYFAVFKHIFTTFHGLRNIKGESQANSATCYFCEKFDKASRTFTIQGQTFPFSKWGEALDLFISTEYPEQVPRPPSPSEH